MLKKLMITTAITGFMIGAAGAEGIPQNSPIVSPAPAAKSTEMTAPVGSSSAKFVNSQRQDQYLASKFKGTDVIGTDGAKIGDVSDILFDKDQKILAYVVGVGGFLGIGAKDVAIAPASFQPVPGKDATDTKLRLSMTKDELKAAQAFEPYKPPRPVSSDASPTRPMGAPAPGGTTGSIK